MPIHPALIGAISPGPFVPAVAGKGYFMGGSQYQYDEWVRIFLFTEETVSQGSDNLNSTPYGGDGTNGTNGTAGYNSQSQNAAPHYAEGKIDRITYATDATDVVSETMTLLRASPGMCFNDGTAFYAFGGVTSSNRSEIDKWTIPSETQSQLSDYLSQGAAHSGGASDGTTAGYRFGGYAGAQPGSAVIDKIAFSDDCVTTESDVLEAGNYWTKATSDYSARKGYITHGGADDDMTEMAYATGVTSLSGDPFTGVRYGALCTNNGVAAYQGGGYDTVEDSIYKKVYASGTISLILETMPEPAYNMTACENHALAI